MHIGYAWLPKQRNKQKNEEQHSCQLHPSVWNIEECTFLLLSPSPFSLLLFCSYGDRVEHFRVLEGGGQYCIWEESFCSLNRLVDFYKAHSIAMEKVVCLRDPPSSPRLLSQLGHNPYPNPYKSSSQESLPSERLYSRPSLPKRASPSHLLEPAVVVWRIMRHQNSS